MQGNPTKGVCRMGLATQCQKELASHLIGKVLPVQTANCKVLNAKYFCQDFSIVV